MGIEKRKRKNGTTAYRVKVERDGVQHSKTFSLLEDARRGERDLIRRLENGGVDLQAPKVTFKDCVEFWRTTRAAELTPSTLARYESLLENFLLPKLGKRFVSQLKAKDVIQVLSSVQWEQGWSAGSYNKLLTCFQSVWSAAYKAQLFETDQLSERLERKTVHEVERYVPHPSDVHTMLERLRSFCESNPHRQWGYVLTVLLATFALRRAEAAALRIEDVDFATMKLRIAHAICPETGKLKGTKTLASDYPPIPARVADILARYIRTLPAGAIYLFHSPSDPGAPRELHGITRTLKGYYKKCGFELMRPKTLRAFNCTTTGTVGASQGESMSLSRHKDSRVFLKHYFVARDDRRREILENTIATFLPPVSLPAKQSDQTE